jgi:hypothetical protein
MRGTHHLHMEPAFPPFYSSEPDFDDTHLMDDDDPFTPGCGHLVASPDDFNTPMVSFPTPDNPPSPHPQPRPGPLQPPPNAPPSPPADKDA